MALPTGSSMHIQPLVPARNCFICPSAPRPITVASLRISGGPALTAFAIVAASALPPPCAIAAWPDFAFGLSWVIFMLSCADTTQAVSTRTPVTIAAILRIRTPPFGGLIERQLTRYYAIRSTEAQPFMHAISGADPALWLQVCEHDDATETLYFMEPGVLQQLYGRR